VSRLIYSALASLDGYVADARGNFDWAAPDEEVHAFVNDLLRPVGTQLLGRRMYEVLAAWDHPEAFAGESRVMWDFAEIWGGQDKIVFSRTLQAPTAARTRVERALQPTAIRALKASADRDLAIGGPEVAGQALRAGLVDECHLLLSPAIVGGGTRALPDGLRLDLELLDERRFGNGVVYLRYSCSTGHQ
jgi:dihydrofolate reductase